MAKWSERAGREQQVVRSSLVDWLPFIVVALLVAHLLAFVYWIYRLATEKQPERRKTH